MAESDPDLEYFESSLPQNTWVKRSPEAQPTEKEPTSPKARGTQRPIRQEKVADEDLDYFQTELPQNSWYKPPPSIGTQLKNAPGLAAREIGAFVSSLPSTTAEMYRGLANDFIEEIQDIDASLGKWSSPEDIERSDKFVNQYPDWIKSLNKPENPFFKTYQEQQSLSEANLSGLYPEGLPREGRGKIEKAAITGARALPFAALGGGATSALLNIGVPVALEAAGAGEKGQLAGNLTIPAIINIIKNLSKKGGYLAAPEKQQVYQEGQRLGMSDKELAPLLATEKQVGKHAKRATNIAKTEQAFQNTGDTIGSILDEIQNRPGNLTPAAKTIERDLLRKWEHQRDQIKLNTHALSPDEKAGIDFLNNAISDVKSGGTNIKSLIGTTRSANKIGADNRFVQQARKTAMEAIDAINPQTGKDLAAGNLIYKNYIKNLGKVNPGEFAKYYGNGNLQTTLGAIFAPQTLPGKLKIPLARTMANKISSLVLTNPKAQSLVRNFGKALRDGRRDSSLLVAGQLKEFLRKNNPEEYKEMEWDRLGLDD